VPPISRQQEMDALKAQAEYLEDALEGVRMQLKELEERQSGKQGT
jgi:prefoldin subunit 5